MKLTRMTKATDVPAYIADFPPSTRILLKQMRALVKKTIPKGTEEVISYGIPGYLYKGMLVYFAGYDKHIGFYPGAATIAHFKKELVGYKLSKGTVQFPLDKALPVGLITRMIKSRVASNEAKDKAKKSKKPTSYSARSR